MDTEVLLSELLDVAEKMGLEIRHVLLDGDGGGLCCLRGQWVLFVDGQASLEDCLATTVEALASRPELDDFYIRPQLRAMIESYKT
ncbi:MAG: hypothetical protein K9M57_01430 [Phycisphaerae bacterium]|nr:hypothetical protein [Phycisphaerae bacterium]